MLLTRLGQALIAELRVQLSQRILEAPLRHIEQLGAHRLLAALNDDPAVDLEAYIHLPLLCVNLATVLGCLAYIGRIAWSALAIVLGAMALGALLFRAHQRRAMRAFTRARETSDALFKHFRGLTGGIKELKMHSGRGRAFVSDVLGGSVTTYARAFVAGTTEYAIAMGWGTLLFYAVLGIALFALPVWAGLTTPARSGVVLAMLFLMTPFAQLVELLPSVGRASIALDKASQLGLALTPEAAAPPRGGGAEGARATWERIELAGVTHRYYREKEEGSFELGPIDLTFRPGEIVYLVGGNGSGKTTLSLLLLGLYTPESGEIRLDGAAVDDASRERYRQLFSVVFADFHLFEHLLGLHGPDLDERARRYLERLQLDHRVRVEQGALRVTGLSQGSASASPSSPPTSRTGRSTCSTSGRPTRIPSSGSSSTRSCSPSSGRGARPPSSSRTTTSTSRSRIAACGSTSAACRSCPRQPPSRDRRRESTARAPVSTTAVGLERRRPTASPSSGRPRWSPAPTATRPSEQRSKRHEAGHPVTPRLGARRADGRRLRGGAQGGTRAPARARRQRDDVARPGGRRGRSSDRLGIPRSAPPRGRTPSAPSA